MIWAVGVPTALGLSMIIPPIRMTVAAEGDPSIVVNSLDDPTLPLPDDECDVDKRCTLRGAIEQARTQGRSTTIEFSVDISGDIQLRDWLPDLFGTVVIRDPRGSRGSPVITIIGPTGAAAPNCNRLELNDENPGVGGLVLHGAASRIEGLGFDGFPCSAIAIARQANGTTISGNTFGVRLGLRRAVFNLSASDVSIDRNASLHNSGAAFAVSADALTRTSQPNGNSVTNNWIGTTDGTSSPISTPEPDSVGVVVEGICDDPDHTATSVRVIGNTVLAQHIGVLLEECAADTTVADNYLGSDADSAHTANTPVFGNTVGVRIDHSEPSATNQIDHNVIVGGEIGVHLTNQASNVTVTRNLIGLDQDEVAHGMSKAGVLIDRGAHDNVIGYAPAANIATTGWSCSTDAGTKCNWIAHNEYGVVVADQRGDVAPAGENNTIRGNSMFENAKGGIDLDAAGVSKNDIGTGSGSTTADIDADDGPNAKLNAPTMVSANRDPKAGWLISGVIDMPASVTRPSEVTIDVYELDSDDTKPENLSYPANTRTGPVGQGRRWVGQTNPKRNGQFSIAFPGAETSSRSYVATATDSHGNTSEFSGTCIDAGSVFPDGDPDSDLDGLCDDWERDGIDYDRDGIVDLRLDSDVRTRDLYLELDWQVPASIAVPTDLEATGAVVRAAPTINTEQLIRAFAESPRDDVTGQPIRLHVNEIDSPLERTDRNEVITSNAPIDAFLSGAGSVFELRDGVDGTICTGWLGSALERSRANCAAIIGARRSVERYAIVSNQPEPNNPDFGGATKTTDRRPMIIYAPADLTLTDAPGCGTMSFSGDVQGDAERCVANNLTNILFHELGHTLGLQHGGNEEVNAKPNYFSAMNYMYNDRLLASGSLTYSRWGPEVIGAIDPANPTGGGPLFAEVVRQDLVNHGFYAVSYATLPDCAISAQPLRDALNAGWLGPVSLGLQPDVLHGSCVAPSTPIAAFDDYAHLDFVIRDDPPSTAGPSSAVIIDPRPDLTQLSIADVDGDGTPDMFDNCRATSNPDQLDRDADGLGDLCDEDRDVRLTSAVAPGADNTLVVTFTASNAGPDVATDLSYDLSGSSDVLDATASLGQFFAGIWTIPALGSLRSATLVLTVEAPGVSGYVAARDSSAGPIETATRRSSAAVNVTLSDLGRFFCTTDQSFSGERGRQSCVSPQPPAPPSTDGNIAIRVGASRTQSVRSDRVVAYSLVVDAPAGARDITVDVDLPSGASIATTTPRNGTFSAAAGTFKVPVGSGTLGLLLIVHGDTTFAAQLRSGTPNASTADDRASIAPSTDGPDAPGNDDVAAAVGVSGDLGVLTGTTVGATSEAFEGNDLATVWFSWTPVQSGVVTFNLSSPAHGSSSVQFDGFVSLYASGVAPLAEPDWSQLGRRSRWRVEGGRNYLIRVASGASLSSWADFGLTYQLTTAPINDEVAAAIAVTGFNGNVAGTTLGSTRQSGEANITALLEGYPARPQLPGGSVWYRWVAPESGALDVSSIAGGPVENISIRTLLAVYDGTSIGAPVVRASNVGVGYLCCDIVRRGDAAITDLRVTKGRSYLFQVFSTTSQGFAGRLWPDINGQGEFTLSWNLHNTSPSAPDGVTATPGDGSIHVTWSPADGRGGTISGYTVTVVSRDTSATVDVDGATTTADIFGLTNSDTFEVTVTATNEFGLGPPSPPVLATPFASNEPSLFTFVGWDRSGTDTTASFTWQLPADLDSLEAMTLYAASIGTGTLFSQSLGVDATVGYVSIDTGEEYQFNVAAAYGGSTGGGHGSGRIGPLRAPGPRKPQAVVAEASIDGLVRVSWTPGQPTTDSVVGWNITLTNTSVDGFPSTSTRISDPTVTSTVLSGVVPGDVYVVSVGADAAWPGTPTYSDPFSVSVGAPAAPTLSSVVGGFRSLTVVWVSPVNTGSSPITGYVVTARPVGSPRSVAITVNDIDNAQITGLDDATTYDVTVAAMNDVGTGPASASLTARTSALPGPPAIVTIAANPGSLTVNWTAPDDDGGSPVLGYVVTATPADGGPPTTTTTNAQSATLLSLTDGTSYSVTVAAQNLVGAGPPSNPVTATTPRPPDGPLVSSVIGGVGSVSATWAAPANDGGSPVTGYLITAAPVGGGNPRSMHVSAAGTAQLSGLADATSYAVTVTAVNAVGSGSSSSPTVVTTASVPGPPSITAVTAGPQSLTIAWSAPSQDGGSPVTGYSVTATPVTGARSITSTTGPVNSATLSGLADAASYVVTVTATNLVGSGAPSAPVVATTPPSQTTGLPGTPLGVAATGGVRAIAVSWTPPAFTGSPPITGYQLRVTPVAGGATVTRNVGAVSSGTLTGLLNGTSYQVAVAARNGAGVGTPSTTIVVSTFALPDPPSIGSASGAVRSITVGWVAPPISGGSPILGYVIQVTPSTGGTTTTKRVGLVDSAVVGGLANGTSYTVTVAGRTAVGLGGASPPSSATTYGTPTTPTILTAHGATRSISVSWSAPANTGGAPILGYSIRLTAPTGSITTRNVANVLTATVSGLHNDTTYAVTVSARNVAGTGPPSTSLTVMTFALPGAPTLTGAVGAVRSVDLSWTAPPNDGAPITGYLITAVPGDGGPQVLKTVGTATNARVGGLANGTTYSVTVAARSAVGTGPPSAQLTAATSALPAAPTITDATPGTRSIRVTWTDPSSDASAPITAYVVRATPINGGPTVTRTINLALTTTIIGLTTGMSYSVTVAARNAVGVGPPSAPTSTSPR